MTPKGHATEREILGRLVTCSLHEMVLGGWAWLLLPGLWMQEEAKSPWFPGLLPVLGVRNTWDGKLKESVLAFQFLFFNVSELQGVQTFHLLAFQGPALEMFCDFTFLSHDPYNSPYLHLPFSSNSQCAKSCSNKSKSIFIIYNFY